VEELVPGFDVVEIFLEFRIALQERLFVGIEVSQISDFATSGITQLDL
jgi:hypothetical protein